MTNIKKTLICAAFAALASGAAASQEAPAQDMPDMAEAREMFRSLDIDTKIQLMKQFDADGDGRLNREERMAAIRTLRGKVADLDGIRKKHARDIIAKFDLDGDGKLDETEMCSFLDEQRKMFEASRAHRGRNFAVPKEVLAKFDLDGDGKLSRDERRNMMKFAQEKRAALIKKYDTNGDGVLDEHERNALVKDPEVQKALTRMIEFRPPEPPPAD